MTDTTRQALREWIALGWRNEQIAAERKAIEDEQRRQALREWIRTGR